MGESKTIIHPAGGIHRSFAFPGQPPYTTPDACNVRSTGPLTGRARGGTRPGKVKAFAQRLDGTPQLLASVRPAAGNYAATFFDDFEMWTAGQDLPGSADWWVNGLYGNNLYVSKTADNLRQLVGSYEATGLASNARHSVCPSLNGKIDIAKPYALEMSIRSYNTWAYNDTDGYYISLIARTTGSTGDWTVNGLQFKVTPKPSIGKFAVTITERNGGALTHNVTTADYNLTDPIHLSVSIDGNNVAVFANYVMVDSFVAACPGGATYTTSAIYTYLPNRGVASTKAFLGGVDYFRITYAKPTLTLDYDRSYLVTASEGYLWHENAVGELVKGSLCLSPTLMLQAAEWGGRLFIADRDTVRVEKTGCTISNLAGTGAGRIIRNVGVATWATFGILTDQDVVVVTQAGVGGMPYASAYRIAEINTADLVLLDCPVSFDSNISIKVVRAPKEYNPLTNAWSIVQQGFAGGWPLGTVPTGCPLCCRYMDRLVWAGDPPHVFYMSREGNPWDYNFGASVDDLGRACGGGTGEAGQIGPPITALVPSVDGYLIFGCATELWVLHGNLTAGGQIINLSDKVGIVGAFAWTRTPSGGLIFLAHDGLYSLAPGGNSQPELLSARLPRELREIDLTVYQPVVTWDGAGRGVNIYLVKLAESFGASPTAHWTYSLQHDAFWIERGYFECEPFAVAQYLLTSIPGNSLLLACRDGYIRRYSEEAGYDEGTNPGSQIPLNAYVLLGPFKFGNAESVLNTLEGIMAEGSGPVAWELYSGETPEKAYANYLAGSPRVSGSWTGGRNRLAISRQRGVAHYLLLKSPPAAVTRWEMEEILANFEPGGMYRPL